ncbi:putative coiled-coil domain-containing protein 195 [Dromaius novaehollandiae]|uniref:putative coiled-coil domain-containing protein 195 n=1 Tax=Dromaius novaehollandiae TaxID=8790 RepID=UPI00311EE41C
MMEGNTHLLQVIRKMRLEINKLERENRALRGELYFCGQRALQKEQEAGGEGGDGEFRSLANSEEESVGSPVPLCRNILTGPTLEPKEQKDNAMTVRRYSVASSAQAASGVRPHRGDKRPPSDGLLEVRGSAQPPTGPATAQLTNEEEKGVEKIPANCFSKSNSSKMKLFQERVYKCRSKMKAVSFLLPMDVSSYAENPGSLKCPQNQNTKQLTTIIEKDM